MSFQMIHMEIAYRVMEKLSLTEGREAFMLGSVAPDAVHMRADYTVESKIHSHLFESFRIDWLDLLSVSFLTLKGLLQHHS